MWVNIVTRDVFPLSPAAAGGVMREASIQRLGDLCVYFAEPASNTWSQGMMLFRGLYTRETGMGLSSFLIYLILEDTCDKQMIWIRGGGGQQDDPIPTQVTL